ncbi:MAG: leucyl aminopeptidase [Bacteroidales bacterium]|nr:leucyl aminopeptidase [Bacteroidales bacterium]
MLIEFVKSDDIEKISNHVWLISDVDRIPHQQLEKSWSYVREKLVSEKKANVFHYPGVDLLFLLPTCSNIHAFNEELRRLGNQTYLFFKNNKISEATLVMEKNDFTGYLYFLEGFLLSSYYFDKYKSEKESFRFEKIILPESIKLDFEGAWKELTIIQDAVFFARDLVNEPPMVLNSQTLPQLISDKLKGIPKVSIEILGKQQLEELNMGGILGVNKGSFVDPTLTIIHYKGTDKETQPIVLVGKGITFDTGGINLKPTDALATMKCDMSGAATVAGALYAIARAGLTTHVYGLIPATDNRPGREAYVPGDILRMYNKKTVEVKNTDAEGRIILADALAYAEEKMNPALLITIATLTGAAHIAVGDYAIAGMEQRATDYFQKLIEIGQEVHERIIPFPLWDEFGESLKSDVADISNSGSRYGGAIIAGKFLEFFTTSPFIHLDIAGPAFLDKPYHYLPAGGTGIGVRLLFTFIKSLSI